VVHRAGYKSRLHARRLFYEKVKILFDLGYETDKIVLLQTVLLLTFWGPQMKSYWNPCSWIGFGVTIAESLGIYKSTTSANLRAADRSLLRRLWWTLAARDAYCAALLGRPFRINMARCDTQMLSLSDFNSESSENVAAIYQIQVAKLSIILRQIVLSRSDPTCDADTIEMLRNMLNRWQTELPPIVNWQNPANMADVYATSLKIVFHHHLIVLHLGDPHSISNTINRGMEQDTQSAKIAELAAQTISSSALALMMNSMVSRMPHEVFSGFFIASIVFYRQMKQPNIVLRQLGQAALDNCQMVMYEARERWDAAQWALRIFQFLLSKSGNDESQADGTWQSNNTAGRNMPMSGEMDGATPDTGQFDASNPNDILHSIDFDSPTNQDLMWNFNDIVFMPNYFMAAPDESLKFQF
jgi:Fungal specific transcription factor domain